MSVEEDTELRDLITQTLETNGCFAKIRAQLRASIFLALDEDDSFQKKEILPNKKLRSILESVEGKIMFCIVREFLEHFDLDFTISVFEPESYMGSSYEYMGRYKLIEDLNIPNLEQESPDPVLLQLIQLCKLGNKSISLNDTENSVSSLICKNDLINENICNKNNSIISAANDSYNDSHTSSKNLSNNSVTINALNKTFDIKTQDLVQSYDNTSFESNKVEEDSYNNSKLQLDDTLKDKPLIDFDKSARLENITNKSDSEKSKYIIDQSIVDADFSPPVVKESKHSKFDSSFDKLKLSSPKSDKIKVKNNLSSLSDLPPLQMTKSRTNDMLLPSLYTKEFKDKNNIKDVEKLFELEPLDNYEEDFISESDIDLTMGKQDEISKANSFQESQCENVTEKKQIVGENMNNNCTVPVNEVDLVEKKNFNSDNSTVSSVASEDFELSTNVDDILNSC